MPNTYQGSKTPGGPYGGNSGPYGASIMINLLYRFSEETLWSLRCSVSRTVRCRRTR